MVSYEYTVIGVGFLILVNGPYDFKVAINRLESVTDIVSVISFNEWGVTVYEWLLIYDMQGLTSYLNFTKAVCLTRLN